MPNPLENPYGTHLEPIQMQPEVRTHSSRTAGAHLAKHAYPIDSDLILKPYLQHLDLGLTGISSEVVRTCVQSLKYSRGIQSLHLDS